MVVSADIFIDDDVLIEIQQQYTRFPALAKAAFDRTGKRLKRQLEQRLRTTENYPRLPTLPFVWSLNPIANAKARRYYFANKVPRGSSGGRYQRTGGLAQSYVVIYDFDFDGDTVLGVQNTAPGSEYVIGERQVPSHQRSGWEQLDDVALDYAPIAQEAFIDTWFILSDPFAGVPR